MTRAEIKDIYKKADARLDNILSNGVEIGYLPAIPNNKYYLLDNIVWYYPCGSYPIHEGTLEEFKEKIKNNMVRIKLIKDINKL